MEPASQACPHCRATVVLDGASAGGTPSCPACGEPFAPPATPVGSPASLAEASVDQLEAMASGGSRTDACAALEEIANRHRNSGNLLEYAATLERLASRLPSGGAERLVLAGEILSGFDRARAIACWERAVADDPTCVRALEHLVAFHEAASEWQNLLAALNLLIAAYKEKDPKQAADAFCKKGSVLLHHLAMPDKAKQHFRLALGVDPGHVPALLALAALAEEEKDTATLRELLEKLVALGNADARERLARLGGGAPVVAAEPPVVAGPPKKKCPSCGTQTDLLAPVCGSCGAPFPTIHPSLHVPPSPASGSDESTAEGDGAVPDLVAGRYRLSEKLGKGGAAVVYRAWDTKLEEETAIKILHQDARADATEIARFKREITTARKVTHPNVIRIHDFGESGSDVFISMEILPGGTLSQKMKQGLTLKQGLDVAVGVAEGVSAAHALGIVHRDLKPDNILFDENGRPKVVDFGLARLQVASSSTLGFSGTPFYMSPEHANGSEVTLQSDVYSLGVVFYQLFTGRLPFMAENFLRLVAMHCTEQPPPMQKLAPGLPAELERVILRALEKDPSKRHANAGELAAELKRVSLDATNGAAVRTENASVLDAWKEARGGTAPAVIGAVSPTAAGAPTPSRGPAPAPAAAPVSAPASVATPAPRPRAEIGEGNAAPIAAPPRRFPLVPALGALAVVGVTAVVAAKFLAGAGPETVASATPTATLAADATPTSEALVEPTTEPLATAEASPEPTAVVEASPAATAVAARTPTPARTPRATPVAVKSTPTPTPTPASTATPRPTATPTVVAMRTATPVPATPTPVPVATAAPVDPRLAAFQHGNDLLKQGKISEAVRELKKAVKAHESYADGHFFLAAAYAAQGEDAYACNELKRYLELAPKGRYADKARVNVANCN